jgi:hypothetical protein
LDATKSWADAGQIERYLWHFDDDNTAEGAIVPRQYDKAGVYRTSNALPRIYAKIIFASYELGESSGQLEKSRAVMQQQASGKPRAAPFNRARSISDTSDV